MAQFENYLVEAKLGRGGMGEVFLATRTGRKYALKQVRLTQIWNDEKALRNARNEVQLIVQLPKHCNIVEVYRSFEDVGFHFNSQPKAVFRDEGEHCLYIEMEYCDGGNLSQQIVNKIKEKKFFSEQMVWNWFRQLCHAVKFLHDNGLIHRDIKPENVYLVSNGAVVKLGDFGIAKLQNTVDSAFAGTFSYMAPEACASDKYQPHAKQDVWALGVLLYHLSTLSLPFGEQLNAVVASLNARKRPTLPTERYSSGLLNFTTLMLTFDPKDRPTMAQIVDDVYIKTGENEQALPQSEAVVAELAKCRSEISRLNQQVDELRSLQAVVADKLDKLLNEQLQQQFSDAVLCNDVSVAGKMLQNRDGKLYKNYVCERWWIVRNGTALHRACLLHGSVDMIRLLIDNGADVNSKEDDGGETPLHGAASMGRWQIVKLLLQRGSDQNAESTTGWTPLMAAAFHGHLQTVQELLDNGADQNYKVTAGAYKGYTALKLASTENHNDVVELLKKNVGPLNWLPFLFSSSTTS